MLDRELLVFDRKNNNEKLSVVTDQILAYLADNPDAQDTFEGIVQWWLLQLRIQQQSLLVKEAIASLVSEGWIIERRGVDTRIRYQVNPSRRGHIRDSLAGH